MASCFRKWAQATLVLVLFFTAFAARADYSVFVINQINPPPPPQLPQTNYTFRVTLMVNNEVAPCGTFLSYVQPPVGAAIPGSSTNFSANGSYDSTATVTLPAAPGIYAYQLVANAYDCNGVDLFTRSFDINLEVAENSPPPNSGNPEDDLRILSHTFPNPLLVGLQTCGRVRIINDGNTDYDVDDAYLDERGVDVTWSVSHVQQNTTNLAPGDRRTYSDFCFTPDETGNLDLDITVEVLVDNDWLDIELYDSIELQVLENDCYRQSCNGDDVWCFNSRNALTHLSLDCPSDVQGQVCGNQRCSGNQIICTRQDTDNYCAAAACQSTPRAVDQVVRTCAANEFCQNAACVVNNPQAGTTCFQSDVYWIDSLGARTAKRTECGNSSTAFQNICSGNQVIQQSTTTNRGCEIQNGQSVCYARPAAPQNVVVQTCAANQMCSGGACVNVNQQAGTVCFQNDIYWVDALGNRTALQTDCGINSTDTSLVCSANHIFQRSVTTQRGCELQNNIPACYTRAQAPVDQLQSTCIQPDACINGACVNQQAGTVCYQDDVYWVDALGGRGALRTDCGIDANRNQVGCEGLSVIDKTILTDRGCERVGNQSQCFARDSITNNRLVQSCGEDAVTPWAPTRFCADLTHTISARVATDASCANAQCSITDTTETINLPCGVGQICRDGACVQQPQCVSNWSCGQWNVCNGQAESQRVCVDLNACTPGQIETRPCDCEITNLSWSSAEATDGDPIGIIMEHQGSCEGQCFDVEIWERDWGPLIDDFNSTQHMCIADNNTPSQSEWVALLQRNDMGFSEYYLSENSQDVESDEDTDLLVKPHEVRVEDTITLMLENIPSPEDQADLDCLRHLDVTTTPHCLDVWEESGMYLERENEQTVSDLWNLLVGENTSEAVYNFACTACAFGTVRSLFVCVDTGGLGCATLLTVENICRYGCLEFLEQSVGLVAGKLWNFLMDTKLGEIVSHLQVPDWRQIAASTDSDVMVWKLHQNPNRQTVNTFVYQSPENPERIGTASVINNPLASPDYPNVGDYLKYNEHRDRGKVLLHHNDIVFDAYREFPLLQVMFKDEKFFTKIDTYASELKGNWAQFSQITETLEFSELIDDDLFIFGETRGFHHIQISLKAARNLLPPANGDLVSREASSFIANYVVPHEMSHAIFSKAVFNKGMNLAPANPLFEPMQEFLNDYFAYARLSPSNRKAYAINMRLLYEKYFAANAPQAFKTEVKGLISSFTQWASPLATPPQVYGLAAFRARLLSMGYADLDQALLAQLEAYMQAKGYAQIKRQNLRLQLGNLTQEIIQDSDHFKNHLLDAGNFDRQMGNILCKYGLVECIGNIPRWRLPLGR